MKTARSRALFQRANSVIPGAVNSPVRAFRSVGGNPLFIKQAKGVLLEDVDGNKFVDYVLSWGPMILGHGNSKVLRAVISATKRGTSYGAPCGGEVELAQLIVNTVPSIEQVRLVNSGTEAVMSAIRLARAYTKRDAILKFEGCYHGHADHLLVKAGSGVATLGMPDSPGVPESFARHTLTAPYNDIKATEKLIHKHAQNLGAIIVEPVAGNMGVVPPTDEFLPWLRMITKKYDILLIFDEVITGFRVHVGGAQVLYKVTPDLTCLGKIIGGGLPIGAYGGRKDIMQMIAPAGPVYQAGTLSGNPVAVAAGLETLRLLKRPGVYKDLEKRSKLLAEGLGEAAKKAKIPYYQTRVGSMLGGFFTEGPVTDYAGAKKSDTERYAKFFHGMLNQGVYLAPSQFEAMLLSTAHTNRHIQQTIAVAEKVFPTLQ
ncbi:MAG TPA: glutamate-1-semialdehyde 2,1-aminomutase [Nitrospirales bacterium]|nr:glutamate-1-semialdehyde 2,1-aminomutase [Nitrospirales bacterium]